MLKLNASYSKKIPASEEFSSQSYHCAVEVELPDGLSREELGQRIHETFGLVKQSVESELTAAGDANSFRFPQPDTRCSGSRDQVRFTPASEKQLSFLRDIAVRRGMTAEELDKEAARFRAGSIDRLSRGDASRLIDILGAALPAGQRGQAA